MGDPGLVRIQDIADVRIIPGTRMGEVLREKGLGNAGAHGGPYGDLVVRVKIVGRAQAVAGMGGGARPQGPAPEARRATPSSTAEAPTGERTTTTVQPDGTHVRTLDITLVEALLGGRVHLDTEHGPVRLSIAPGTSGGTKLRLRGKGPRGDDGQPTDLYVVTRVVVPRSLDEESRRLIERFAQLNPD
jgi:DnaJ-class molecular chaperone